MSKCIHNVLQEVSNPFSFFRIHLYRKDYNLKHVSSIFLITYSKNNSVHIKYMHIKLFQSYMYLNRNNMLQIWLENTVKMVTNFLPPLLEFMPCHPSKTIFCWTTPPSGLPNLIALTDSLLSLWNRNMIIFVCGSTVSAFI